VRSGALWLMALAICGGCGQMPPARDVTLVATGMAFVLPDEPNAVNPPLTFRPGERVRLILRNEAPGMRHDVAIPAWDVAVDPVGFGERAEVTFTVPADASRVDYHCRPHAAMMRGQVDVRDTPRRAANDEPPHGLHVP
jgi:plastocyanin